MHDDIENRSMQPLRSYSRLICEYELHILAHTKVTAERDHGKICSPFLHSRLLFGNLSNSTDLSFVQIHGSESWKASFNVSIRSDFHNWIKTDCWKRFVWVGFWTWAIQQMLCNKQSMTKFRASNSVCPFFMSLNTNDLIPNSKISRCTTDTTLCDNFFLFRPILILAIVTNYRPDTSFRSNFRILETTLPITLVCDQTAAKW